MCKTEMFGFIAEAPAVLDVLASVELVDFGLLDKLIFLYAVSDA